MKIAVALLASTVAAQECSGVPKIEITGGGSWQPGEDGIPTIVCDSPTAIPNDPRITCKKGRWRKRRAAHCFEPPTLPDFLDRAEITNPDVEFKCMIANDGHREKEPPYRYWFSDGKYAHQLYIEALKYLEGYAVALTTNDGICRNSDLSIVQTQTHEFGGPEYHCIMDQRDMRLLVKHIYFTLYHPWKAMRCFNARENVGWMYGVGGILEEDSNVAKWLARLGRRNLQQFFDDESEVPNAQVREFGKIFAQNFSKMVTGPDIKMPDAFPFDISANALPNLWAAAGWVPMYAWDSERNKKNFIKTRGGYAYAEIYGHWGLIRIDEIDGQKVGAEIGMVAQQIDTFYPFHNHAIPEIYYTIREPACAEEFNNFAIRENNPMLKTLNETDTMREVEFDGSHEMADSFWVPTSPKVDDLVYFHENTIHAFHIKGEDCHAKPEEKAIVTVWARSMAHDRRNDYGTTLLCESSANPETPALKEALWRCDLTKTKWRRSVRSAEEKQFIYDERFCPYCQ